MKKLLIGSVDKGAGKTSLIVGLAKNMNRSIGYMKPFGDRLLYKKKRLWDYDSALVTSLFDLEESPEEMSIGFEHAKLRYMYDREGTKVKLSEIASHVGKNKDALFVEMGKDLHSGASLYLDPLSICSDLDGELILVLSGEMDKIVDEIAFIKTYLSLEKVNFRGVIINKVKDVEDFRHSAMEYINEYGINVLGIVPYREELSSFTISYLADALFGKVIAGQDNLNSRVKRVFVGAMSANTAMDIPHFKEPNKLVISSGDRHDMLIAAIETGSAGIILAGNILPPSNIISKAAENNIPMLLVAPDTFRIAKQIDDLEPLLTKDAPEKADLLGNLVKENISLGF